MPIMRRVKKGGKWVNLPETQPIGKQMQEDMRRAKEKRKVKSKKIVIRKKVPKQHKTLLPGTK